MGKVTGDYHNSGKTMKSKQKYAGGDPDMKNVTTKAERSANGGNNKNINIGKPAKEFGVVTGSAEKWG